MEAVILHDTQEMLETIEQEDAVRETIKQEIIIDDEFSALLPELSKETYAWLEDNILQYGCHEPLVLWGNTLIDGHHRYEISQKHDVPFNTVTMEFISRDAAIIWIISTQIARRNMNPTQLSYYRGLHYIIEKRIVKNESGKNQYSKQDEVKPHNEVKPNYRSTSARLADIYNVSKATIERDAYTAEAITAIGEQSPEAQRKILACSAKISKKKLRELLSDSGSAIKDIAASIEDGTYARRQVSATTQDSDETQTDLWSEMLLPVEKEFNSITKSFSSHLRNLYGSDDPEALRLKMRLALRNCIAMLEDLHARA